MPTTPGSEGGPGNLTWNTKKRFLAAERQQESGGNYQVVNPGSGALGAYQVMPGNLPGWLREAGLPPLSPYAYLHDPAAQDRLAWVILGGYYDTYGPAGAAAMWYSGQPDPNKTYGNPPVYQYVADVIALMHQALPIPNYGPAPGGPAFTLPPPNTDDSTPTIRAAAADLVGAAHILGNAGNYLLRLR